MKKTRLRSSVAHSCRFVGIWGLLSLAAACGSDSKHREKPVQRGDGNGGAPGKIGDPAQSPGMPSPSAAGNPPVGDQSGAGGIAQGTGGVQQDLVPIVIQSGGPAGKGGANNPTGKEPSQLPPVATGKVPAPPTQGVGKAPAPQPLPPPVITRKVPVPPANPPVVVVQTPVGQGPVQEGGKTPLPPPPPAASDACSIAVNRSVSLGGYMGTIGSLRGHMDVSVLGPDAVGSKFSNFSGKQSPFQSGMVRNGINVHGSLHISGPIGSQTVSIYIDYGDEIVVGKLIDPNINSRYPRVGKIEFTNGACMAQYFTAAGQVFSGGTGYIVMP